MQASICTSMRKNSNRLSASRTIEHPVDQVLLHEQIADQRLPLILSQLIIERFNNLLPVLLIVAGAESLTDVLGNLMAHPELRGRPGPLEKLIDVHADFISYLQCLL